MMSRKGGGGGGGGTLDVAFNKLWLIRAVFNF